MKIYIEIMTTAGQFYSDTQPDVSSEEVEEAEKFFKHFKNMEYISLTVDGNDVFFNPNNIVYLKIVKESE